MSLESAKAFIERMKTDEDFKKKVVECKDAEARNALVKKEGFDFEVGEVKSSLAQLSEEVLEGVSGGGCGHFIMDGSQICRVVW